MVVVRYEVETSGGLTALGLSSSLILDNQLVDVDGQRRELQYHLMWALATDLQRSTQDALTPVQGPLLEIEAHHPAVVGRRGKEPRR